MEEPVNGQHGSMSSRRTWESGKLSAISSEASYGGETINTGQTKELSDWRRVQKLELPVFREENPDGWLYRTERYFELMARQKLRN